MSEVVAFSKGKFDTHGAYKSGIHYGLLNLLHKLKLARNIAGSDVYVVPVSGYYQVVQVYKNNNVNTNQLQRYNAGDVINIYSPAAQIHRIGS